MVTRAKKKTESNILVLGTEVVPISALKPYDRNPRIGNVEEIAKSLSKTKMYKPIIVNKRDSKILAGNHTYLAARQLGWTEMLVSYVDVDDDTAARIVLVDNKTSDMGTYDDKVLAELLASLPDPTDGTGYSPMDLQDLIEEATSTDPGMQKTLDDLLANMPENVDVGIIRQRDERQAALEDMDDEKREASANRGAPVGDLAGDTEVKELEDLEDVQSELQGVLELREGDIYPSDNFWGVPNLRTDMLVDRLPEPLQAWAGIDATPDDGVSNYLWNYGLGGVKGLPFDRAILSFFTHDTKFNNWWNLPAYYTSKVLSAGVKTAIVPDFSFYYTQPRTVHLRGVYEGQWMGRFFQEAGLRVIPRVQFDDEKSLEFCLLGIPKNAPVIACSIQNIDGIEGVRTKEEDIAMVTKVFQQCIDTIEPTTQVLVYGGNPAKRIMENINFRDAEGVFCMNYAGMRRGVAFDKKDGVASLTPAQKKKIRQKAKEREAERLGIDVKDVGKVAVAPDLDDLDGSEDE